MDRKGFWQGPLRAENSWEGLPKGRGFVLGWVEAGGVVVVSEKRAKANLRIFPTCCPLSSNLVGGCLGCGCSKLLARRVSAYRIKYAHSQPPDRAWFARPGCVGGDSQDNAADRIGSR